MATTHGTRKDRVIAMLDTLPEDALIEVERFVDYQRFKRGHRSADAPPYRPIALGGLWKGGELSEEEIDEARRELWGRCADEHQ